MRACLPWVCQGDIFQLLPLITPEITDDGRVGARADVGSALLITHDCNLDKQTRAGDLTIQRLQFIPLLDVAQQDNTRQALLRQERIAPPEAIYVGQVQGVGEAYAMLSETYAIPASYFAPVLRAYPDHADAEESPHFTVTRHDNRVGRLEQERLELLHQKVVAFWARATLDG